MMAEDGWLVRIRPPLGRLAQAQAAGLAALADRHGLDAVELTSRANLQLRGIAEADYPALLRGLQALDLVDPDVHTESRRNLLIAPFWQPGDGSVDLASALTQALGAPQAPALPAKFGLALDCGGMPVLRSSRADIRVERSGTGFLVYADGSTAGTWAAVDQVVEQVLALAQWFAQSAGPTSPYRRMAALLAHHPLPPAFTTTQVPSHTPAEPPLGPVPAGCLVALEFGQLRTSTLATLATIAPLRLTPWRSVLLEGAQAMPALPDLITRADDVRLRIHACTGAPGCGQAVAATRPLARTLAAALPAGQTLHVSGCSKGCAHPGPALTVLAADADHYHLIHQGRAADRPDATHLTPAALATLIQERAHAT